MSATLHAIAWASLALGVVCALIIALDELRHPQKMAVMNLVWPLTALFGSVAWLALYFAAGRSGGSDKPPMAVSVAISASHCGAGCTLGDLVTEWAAFAFPGIAVAFGWGSLFSEKMFAVWIPDFLVAYLFGIVMQYWAIVPMRGLSFRDGIVAALKADTASILAWQIGMYGGMAAIQLGWFAPQLGRPAPIDSPEFWFAMQLAMIAGFATAYPVNWWLIRAGLKERM